MSKTKHFAYKLPSIPKNVDIKEFGEKCGCGGYDKDECVKIYHNINGCNVEHIYVSLVDGNKTYPAIGAISEPKTWDGYSWCDLINMIKNPCKTMMGVAVDSGNKIGG